jgi:hypothetical protein
MKTAEQLIPEMIAKAEEANAPAKEIRKAKALFNEGGASAIMSCPSAPLWLYWYIHVIGDPEKEST